MAGVRAHTHGASRGRASIHVDVLRASQGAAPPLRELYRDQLEAVAVAPEPARPALDEFVFTIELELKREGWGLPPYVHSWQGTMFFEPDRNLSIHARPLDGDLLTGAEMRPADISDAEFLRWLQGFECAYSYNDDHETDEHREAYEMRVLVTHGYRTVLLYRSAAIERKQKPDFGEWMQRWPPQDLPVPCLPARDMYAPFLLPIVEARPWGTDPETPTATAMLKFFDEDGSMLKADDVLEYLQLCLPWRRS